MPWFNLGDDAHSHPKVQQAGNAAFGVWCRMGSYSASYLTDGFVPRKVAEGFGTVSQLNRLVHVGMLELAAGGFQIHDYLDANWARTRVLTERENAAERQRKSRARHGVTHASQANANANANPVSKKEHAAAAVQTAPDMLPPLADEALTIFATWRLNAEGRKVRSTTRYLAALRANEIAAHPELLTVGPDADPVQIAVDVFGMRFDDALTAWARTQSARESARDSSRESRQESNGEKP